VKWVITENTDPLVAYKVTKAAMIAFTEQLALPNAPMASAPIASCRG
jgi:NAD(P)-dependent dehydrogenase (short-subunit alcohol dehydrogenase family)